MGNRFIHQLKCILWKLDLFSSTQLLRYKTEPGYSTLTGGFISLLIIIIFGALLVQNSIQVVTMSTVSAQDFTYYLEEPTFSSFKFDQSSKFIIGVGINNLNLSAHQRHFDIVLSTQTFNYGKLVEQIEHNLQACEYNQWAQVNDIGGIGFNQSNMGNFLCPATDTTVKIQGKFTSETFQIFRLKIGKCSNKTDPSRPCVDEAIVKQQLVYNMNYYFMNAYVNSGTLDPVGYYMQDRNYFGFNLQSTIISNLYLTQNIIQTDNSLLPWSDTQEDSIMVVRELAQVKNSMSFPDQYISVYLRKSPYYILSQRNYVKLQELFSSIGGLFGFALTIFMFMQSYTEAAFEVQMADGLFYYNNDDPLQSNSFNFFYFLAYCVYSALRALEIKIPWKRMEKYYEGRQEVGEQLDLSLLMNKVTFLEKCMNIVFEDYQFRAIYLQQKPNVKDAGNLRKNHGLNKILHKNSKKIHSKIQEQVKLHHDQLVKRAYRPTIEVFDSIYKQQSGRTREYEEKHPYDLVHIVNDFMLKDRRSNRLIQTQIQRQKLNRQSQSQMMQEDFEIQEFTGLHPQKLQFVNTALQDIKKIQSQSSSNVFSSRIYQQLNNDITKEQLLMLKYLETIIVNRYPTIGQAQKNLSTQEAQKMAKTTKSISYPKKKTMMQNLMTISMPQNTDKQNSQKDKAQDIMMQTNNRLQNNDYR